MEKVKYAKFLILISQLRSFLEMKRFAWIWNKYRQAYKERSFA